jgi:Flavodoxin domain
MRAVIVYETLFGNSKSVAEAIADGLRTGAEVDIIDVRTATESVDDVDLLVVGGPTHQLGMTRPGSRRSAETQYEQAPPAAQTGLREWIAALQIPQGTAAAVFDTRLNHPTVLRVLDHAARTTGRLLEHRGAHTVAPPQRFLVESATGPVLLHEIDRARDWGRTLLGLAGPAGRR